MKRVWIAVALLAAAVLLIGTAVRENRQDIDRLHSHNQHFADSLQQIVETLERIEDRLTPGASDIRDGELWRRSRSRPLQHGDAIRCRS